MRSATNSHQYAEEMKQAGLFWPRQVENPATLRINEELGTQIASGLNVDYFLASVGTGATFTGIARSLKRVQSTKAYLTLPAGEYTVPGVDDPAESTVQLPLLDRSLADGDIRVSQQEAVAAAIELRGLGYPVGISAGANVAASKKLAGSGAQGNALIVFPDSSDRYPELLGNI